jgi:hypothetical protein
MTFAALVCMLLLTACAPGTGGTGTGPIQFSSSITFTNAQSAPTLGQLPAPILQSCQATSNLAGSLRLETSSIVLTTPCGTFTYSGTWNVSDANEAEIVGMWEAARGFSVPPSTSIVATLKLKFDSSPDTSRTVLVRVQDGTGSILVNSTTLNRASP